MFPSGFPTLIHVTCLAHSLFLYFVQAVPNKFKKYTVFILILVEFFPLMLTASIQIVAMSATIGNLYEVARFLDAETYTQDFRPVELKEYVKCEDGLYAVNWNAACRDEFLMLERRLSFSVSSVLE
jgi:hypothetical protein